MTIDCDELRANYDTWTPAEHRAFYSRVWDAHPGQAHFAADHAARAIETVRPRTVVELGGWDSQLAAAMLDQYPGIERWTNVEICREAALAAHVDSSRLVTACPDGWFWDEQWEADLFVASHCIEHMSATHLDLTIRALTGTRHLWFDAPLIDGPTNWWGSPTTHVLEVGWDGVTDICAAHGFTLVSATDHVTPPESGGKARACLYARRP